MRLFKIVIINNTKYNKLNKIIKISFKIIKKFLFKKTFVILNFLNLFNLFKLNKKYRKHNKFTESLTFIFNEKKIIFININILKNSLRKKLFLIYNFYLSHSILHCQNFKDDNSDNVKIMNNINYKILKNYGFLFKNLSVIGFEPIKI